MCPSRTRPPSLELVRDAAHQDSPADGSLRRRTTRYLASCGSSWNGCAPGVPSGTRGSTASWTRRVQPLAGLGRAPDRACRPSRGVSPPAFPARPAQGRAASSTSPPAGWAGTRTGPPLPRPARDAATAFWRRLLPALADAGVLSVGTPKDGTARVYGLQPDTSRSAARRRGRERRVRALPGVLLGTDRPPRPARPVARPALPAYRCRGRLVAATGPKAVCTTGNGTSPRTTTGGCTGGGRLPSITAEHTGTLSRPKRERWRRRSGRASGPLRQTQSVLHPDPRTGHRHRRPVRCGPRLPAQGTGQLRAAGRPGRARHRQRLLLTMVDRGPSDLYYLDEPRR